MWVSKETFTFPPGLGDVCVCVCGLEGGWEPGKEIEKGSRECLRNIRK